MSSSAHPNPIAITLNKTCLRMSDVQLLQGPRWLNDQIISFYYEYLQRVKYKYNQDMLFLSPDVTQAMSRLDDDELEDMLHELEAPKKPFIFFVVHDNNDSSRSQSARRCWFLLIFSRPEKAFFHFDNGKGNASKVSNTFMQRIQDALNCRNYPGKQIRCVQQTNAYDWGIIIICMTDNVADNVNRFECVTGMAPLHQDTISAKRSDLLKLIQSLGGKI